MATTLSQRQRVSNTDKNSSKETNSDFTSTKENSVQKLLKTLKSTKSGASKKWHLHLVIPENVFQHCALLVLIIGSALTSYSVYQLRLVITCTGASTLSVRYPQRPVAWIHQGQSWSGNHLRHVADMLEHIGFAVTMETRELQTEWTLFWSHDYPFSDIDMKKRTSKLKEHQRINKFPGSGYITQKRYLSLSKVSYLPMAFALPSDKNDFLETVANNPTMEWVQKNDNHRGIKILSFAQKSDFDKNQTFIQEFVQNPFLIDNKKFDIGIYAVMTSTDPLRVYILQNDILLRFCAEEYHPFDADSVYKYIVGDDYTHPNDIPSLRKYLVDGQFSYKEAFKAYLKEKNHDFDKIWKQIQDAIKETYLSQQGAFNQIKFNQNLKNNYFELVRFDFILDDNMRLYLMEANMSPNLSSGHFPQNSLLYEQVLLNALALAGLATYDGARPHYGEKHIQRPEVALHDIVVNPHVCSTEPCVKKCLNQSCELCRSCFTNDWEEVLKEAYFEHMNRRHMRRILPRPLNQSETITWTEETDEEYQNLPENDQKLFSWFRQKCLEDAYWCS